MKKLLIGLLFGICGVSQAITYQSVRASTSTTLTPAIQNGTMNLSSGTITNVQHTNATVNNTLNTRFLNVSSTASFNGVTGSTISYSSATFTNANVTNILSVGGAINSSGPITTTGSMTGGPLSATSAVVTTSASVGGAFTAQSSSTFRGNVGINGNIDQPLTVTSSATLNGNVLFSSMTGTNLTASNFIANQSTMTFVVLSTVTIRPGSGNPFQAEICAKEVQFTITGTTSTTTSAFARTGLEGSVTPHSTSSYIKLRACGEISTNNGGSVPVYTWFRGSTNLGQGTGASGFQRLQLAGSSANLLVPFCMFYIDSPATVSATTYSVQFAINSNTNNFCASNASCVLGIQECMSL